MTVSYDSYEKMKQAIHSIMDKGITTLDKYRRGGLSDWRYRWDLLTMAQTAGLDMSEIFAKHTDQEIDEVLQRIIKEKEEK